MSSAAAEAQELVSSGRLGEAVNLLNASAEEGDASSLFTLASWRISGQIISRDTALGRELMGRAAATGHLEAALLYAHFLANGTGGPADWGRAHAILEGIESRHPAAAAQLALLKRMAVNENGEPSTGVSLKVLSEEPTAHTCPNFLTSEECAYVIRKAEPRLRPSMVTHRETGRLIAHPVRRSDGTFFGAATEDLVINAINRRIALASKTNSNQGEPLQVLRYSPGGEFRPHHDWVAGQENQRIMTALIYLSEDYQGGETRFLRTGLDFRGRTGELLLFRNVTAEGKIDEKAEHAGLPVRKGVKLITSRWIWSKPPKFPEPVPQLTSV